MVIVLSLIPGMERKGTNRRLIAEGRIDIVGDDDQVMLLRYLANFLHIFFRQTVAGRIGRGVDYQSFLSVR